MIARDAMNLLKAFDTIENYCRKTDCIRCIFNGTVCFDDYYQCMSDRVVACKKTITIRKTEVRDYGN